MNTTDALATQLGVTKPDDRYIYPGATVGGPLRFPGTKFNHSGKLVFFAQAEDYAQRNVYAYASPGQAIYHALVPTPSMLNGDFSPSQIPRNTCPPEQLQSATTIAARLLHALWGALLWPLERRHRRPDSGTGSRTFLSPSPQPAQLARLQRRRHSYNSTNAYSTPASGCMAPYLSKAALTMAKLMPSPNVGVTGANPDGQANQYGYNFVKNNLVNNDMWTAHGRIDFARAN